MSAQIDELAAGIIQVSVQGAWDDATWTTCSDAIVYTLSDKTEPSYWLFDMRAVTAMDNATFEAFVTTPHFENDKVGLAIMVGRKAHLKQAHNLLAKHPQQRNRIQLRLMTNIEDALQTLLDRQVMDRIRSEQSFG